MMKIDGEPVLCIATGGPVCGHLLSFKKKGVPHLSPWGRNINKHLCLVTQQPRTPELPQKHAGAEKERMGFSEQLVP